MPDTITPGMLGEYLAYGIIAAACATCFICFGICFLVLFLVSIVCFATNDFDPCGNKGGAIALCTISLIVILLMCLGVLQVKNKNKN
jgi:hypothetical protein